MRSAVSRPMMEARRRGVSMSVKISHWRKCGGSSSSDPGTLPVESAEIISMSEEDAACRDGRNCQIAEILHPTGISVAICGQVTIAMPVAAPSKR